MAEAEETPIAPSESPAGDRRRRSAPSRVDVHAAWTSLASYGSILVAWIVAAAILPSELMPGPLETIEFVGRQIERGVLWMHLWATARRVLVAFTLGMSIGVVAGAAMGLSRTVDRVFQGWLIAGLTVPRILLFVMSYLIFGLSDTAAIAALVVTIVPTIVVQVREGTRAIDTKLVEMARAYRRPRTTIWRQVVLPQLLPYVVGTARSSLSLAWKMVVLAELLGRTNGIGYQISFYFQMFNMTGILAYGLSMMVVLAAVDTALSMAFDRYAFRWRTVRRRGAAD